MCTKYNDVLKRLVEERTRLTWSKKEMSQHMRMNQSNYHKAELGLRRLSYYELEHLYEAGADVYYIYTGQRSSGKYSDFFCRCSYSELLCFLNVLYSIALMHYKEESAENWKEILANLKYFSLKEKNQHLSNIFLILRHSMGLQQKKMAEKLGVDVKKLRDLETGRKMPDSELLSRLYESFNISPAVVFENKKGLESEIAVSIEKLSMEDKEQVFEIITLLHNMG